MNELTLKKEKFQFWIKAIGLGAVCLAVGPFILLTLGGMAGLLIAGLVGLVAVNVTPVIAVKLSNWKYLALDAEKVSHQKKVMAAAAENPIETLTNLLIAKNKAWKEFEQNVIAAVTAKKTFRTKCDNFKRQYPNRAQEFEVQYANMEKLVSMKEKALKEAKDSLEQGRLKLDEMKAYWDMSQTAQELNKAAGMDTGDIYENMKAETAFDSVFESMNRAFAEIEVAASLQEPLQLSNNSSEKLILDVVDNKQKVKV